MCVCVPVYDLLSGLIVKKLTDHKACVRDVSWHPFEEKIVSSSASIGAGESNCWGLEPANDPEQTRQAGSGAAGRAKGLAITGAYGLLGRRQNVVLCHCSVAGFSLWPSLL